MKIIFMIDKKTIENLSRLARLKLNEEEIDSLTNDLVEIIDYVSKIDELSLDDFEPLTNILEKLDLRDDENLNDFNDEIRNLIIQNFPEKEGSYLKVPKILEK